MVSNKRMDEDLIGGRKEPTFMSCATSGTSETYHDEYAKWYIQTHFYVALEPANAERQHMAWAQLKSWFPVMKPGYELSSKYDKYKLI